MRVPSMIKKHKKLITILLLVAISGCVYWATRAVTAHAPSFDHSNCQYPSRLSNPANSCDNTDPACPIQKDGTEKCPPELIAPPASPEVVVAPTETTQVPAKAPDTVTQAVVLSSNHLESLVNRARNLEGLVAFTSDQTLRNSACNKAQDMVDRNYWSHNRPDGTTTWHFITEAGYNYTKAGENLAKDFNTSEGTVNGWLNSPTHKANIVDDFTDQGICTVKNITVQHLGRQG